jgi:hypothetical protein
MSSDIPSTLCEQVQALDEVWMIQLLEKWDNMRQVVIALLEMGYIVDNYEMTQAGEYPFLPGEKNGLPLLKLNQVIQKNPWVYLL